MKVTIDLDDQVFWKLASRAEGLYSQRVDEYAHDVLTAIAASSVPVETDPVLRLWRERYTDAQIGRRLGLTNHQVAWRRRRLSLPANRRPRKEWEAEEAAARSGALEPGKEAA